MAASAKLKLPRCDCSLERAAVCTAEVDVANGKARSENNGSGLGAATKLTKMLPPELARPWKLLFDKALSLLPSVSLALMRLLK